MSLDQENHFSVAEKSADCIWGKESNNDFVSENEVYYFFLWKTVYFATPISRAKTNGPFAVQYVRCQKPSGTFYAQQCNTVQCSTVQCSTVKYSTVQYSTVPYTFRFLSGFWHTLIRAVSAIKSNNGFRNSLKCVILYIFLRMKKWRYQYTEEVSSLFSALL